MLYEATVPGKHEDLVLHFRPGGAAWEIQEVPPTCGEAQGMCMGCGTSTGVYSLLI